MAQDAGGPVSMTPGLHDLRHFYAAGLIVAGCDVVTVQRALGHQSAVVTLSTYGLLWPTAEDRTRSPRCFSDGVRDVGRGPGEAPAGARPTSSPADSGTSRQRYTLNLNSTTSPSAMT